MDPALMGSTINQNPPQFDESAYKAILLLAENYRTSKPPRMRHCIHCLMSVLHMNPTPPTNVCIRMHMQIGCLIYRHANDYDMGESHLQSAIEMARAIGDHQNMFESVCALAECYLKNSKSKQAKEMLHSAISAAKNSTQFYWCSRLLFQLTKIYHEEGDYTTAVQLLDVGADLARSCNANHLRILFLLSKGMILLVQQNLNEVNKVLSLCGQLIDNVQKHASKMQVAALKVYFLTLQVAHLLSGGQVKSVKSSLKQLQQSMQEISSYNEKDRLTVISQKHNDFPIHEFNNMESLIQELTSMDAFVWLSKEYMYILVYLVTVTHSMLAGYMEKAEKYTEKAMKQIKELKESDSNPLLTRLELMFYESLAQCRLVMCDKSGALMKITAGCRLCSQHSSVPHIMNHTTQMHTLLGMYSMSINCLNDAEKQLQLAVERSTCHEQLVTNLLNLALVHMHTFQLSNGKTPHIKHQELVQILSRISPDSNALKSKNLKAALYYVKGMFAFFQSSYSEAKRYLHEALKISNQQDLNRLTACALVLLGHIYLSTGDRKESAEKVTVAMDIARKMPDPSVQLWAAALLRDLYSFWREEESFLQYKTMHEKLATSLLQDHSASSNLPQHMLTKWMGNPLPPSHLVEIPEESNEKINCSTSTSSTGNTVANYNAPSFPNELQPPLNNNWPPHNDNNLLALAQSHPTSHVPDSLEKMDCQDNNTHHLNKNEQIGLNANEELHAQQHHQPNQIDYEGKHAQNSGTPQRTHLTNEYHRSSHTQPPVVPETDYSITNQQSQQHRQIAGMYQVPQSHLHPQHNPVPYTSNDSPTMNTSSQYSSPNLKLTNNSNPQLVADRNMSDQHTQLQHYSNIQQQQLSQSLLHHRPDNTSYDTSTQYALNQNSPLAYNNNALLNPDVPNSNLNRQHLNAGQLPGTSHLQQAEHLFLSQQGQLPTNQQVQHKTVNPVELSSNSVKYFSKHANPSYMPDMNHSLFSGLSQHSQQQQMYLSQQMQSIHHSGAVQNVYPNNLLTQHNLGLAYQSLGSKYQMPAGLNPQQQQAWLTGQNYTTGDSAWR